MVLFTKGAKAIKIFTTPGLECGREVKIAKVTKSFVQCKGDDHLKYDPSNGRELDVAPGFAAMGISSRIIPYDGD